MFSIGVYSMCRIDSSVWLNTNDTLCEARYLVKESLKKELKKRVKTGVKITIIKDNMVVQLLSLSGTELYRHIIPDLDNTIVQGFNSKAIADAITKDFRKIVLKNYFK